MNEIVKTAEIITIAMNAKSFVDSIVDRSYVPFKSLKSVGNPVCIV